MANMNVVYVTVIAYIYISIEGGFAICLASLRETGAIAHTSSRKPKSQAGALNKSHEHTSQCWKTAVAAAPRH